MVAYINKQGGTRSLFLCLEAESLIILAFDRDQYFRARHLPGKFNVIADALSRPDRIIGTEWSLSAEVFRDSCRQLGTPNSDLFATSRNNKLPVFCSPLPESKAFSTDAMSFSWDVRCAYAYSQLGFLTDVLYKIQRSHCEIFLVAPCWPGQLWFPLLFQLLVAVPR